MNKTKHTAEIFRFKWDRFLTFLPASYSRFFLLGAICLLTNPLFGQDCNYQQFMSEGYAAFDDGDYQLATNKFKAAKVCCTRERIANCEAEEWIIRSQETYVNALQAEKEKLELASNAYRYADENPTHAFRIAEYAITKDPSNDAAREQYLNLLETHPFPFYTSVMSHRDYVSSCAVAPGGDLVATAGWDNRVQLWTTAGELRQTFGDSLSGHQEPVLAITFSPDGRQLLSAGMDNQIMLWDLNGELITTMKGHQGDVTDILFTSDGRTIISGSWDGTIKLWDLQGKEILSIAAHDDFITDLTYSEKTGKMASASWDQSVKIWDLAGNLLQTLKQPDGYITSVDFSKDGKALLSSSWDAGVVMWNVGNGEIIQEFSGHTGIVYKALFTPDNSGVLTCGHDNTVRLWNLHGNQIQSFNYHSGPIRSIAFSPNDEFFVTGGTDGDAVIWYYHGYQDHIYRFGDTKSIADLSYNTADQHMLFASGIQGFLSDKHGRIIKVLDGHQYDIVRTDISEDGRYMASGSLDVYLWDAQGDTVAVYRKHGALIHDVAVNAEKRLVASCGRDDLLCLWDFQGENRFSKKLQPGLDVTNVDFVPGQELIVATTSGGKIFVVDLEGEIQTEITAFEDWITAMAITHNGQRIAVGNPNGMVEIWSIQGELLQEIKTQHGGIKSLDFSPDDQSLLIAGENGGASLWNAAGRIIQRFVGHQAGINRVLFIDEEYILTTGNDGSIRKWRSIQSLMKAHKIYNLSPAERLRYGFADVDSSMIEQTSVTLGDPDDNPPAKIGRQIFDAEKNYYESGKVAFLQFASFYYSKKAHQSKDPEEKISLQQRAIDYHDAFTPVSMGFQKSILHTKLALWNLGRSDIEAAEKNIEKALSYDVDSSGRFKSISSVCKLRKALLLIYQDNWDAAEQLILENINVKPFEGSDFFPQLYYLTSNLYLPENSMTQYQLLEDMDFLESVGAGHPDFEKVRGVLRP